MYNYQKSNRYFAQAADDIKDIATEELISLGAADTSQGYRGIYFDANQEVLYKINYQSRIINRVLAPLISFNCHSEKLLYNNSLDVSWEDFLDPTKTFAVFASVTHSTINHSKFAALRLKDAIADHFKKRTGKRPSVDTKYPDVWFNLFIENDRATISMDTSGGSLHRRGYRKKSIEAPMIETLAAAIIKYSEWDGTVPLYDPFCGSGTFLCEAFMLTSGIPPTYLRNKYGFQFLPDFNAELWNKVKGEASKEIKTLPKGLISGSDISAEAVNSSKVNCSVIDKDNLIKIEQKNVFDLESIEDTVIICNPPYGVRMGRKDDLYIFYKKFGDFLKQRCKGSTAYIYFGDRKYIKNIGLKPKWKKILSNGGLDGRLTKYELY